MYDRYYKLLADLELNHNHFCVIYPIKYAAIFLLCFILYINMNYASGLCDTVTCFFRVVLRTLGQSYDCSSASDTAQHDMC